ncbi:hypothetical protein DSH70_15880 [Enterococcus faecalis]|nr:hypothetical protein [Enterococcus faecalis]
MLFMFDYSKEPVNDYFLIDMKSFYASVECIERNLDPLTTELVVMSRADNTGSGLILASSPEAKKRYGITNVSRPRDLPQPFPKTLHVVPPRMKLYIKRNMQVNNIFRRYVADEDLLIYSIDESILKVTRSLNLFTTEGTRSQRRKKLAQMIQERIKEELGLIAAVGVGDNPLLAKLALDNEAKNNEGFIAEWTYQNVPDKVWNIPEMTDFWGEGKTTASDGMRVPVGVSALKSDVNPHYKSMEKGATMIRSINDRHTTHHIEVASTNTREATHTLDGLLYHETDLDIEEHFTDTNGYSDQVFGMTALLGFDFEPRIRNIKKSQLFSIKSPSYYPNLSEDISGKINVKIIEENYDEIKRIAYSIQTGKVSSSLLLGKLGSYARKNRVALALRELGRIEKSIFMIDYITDSELRRRITHGLNKTEAINALARELFFGRRGKFMERDIRRQLQSASALNVLINAISIWNAVYLQAAYNYLVKIDPEVTKYMKHVSPINWEGSVAKF